MLVEALGTQDTRDARDAGNAGGRTPGTPGTLGTPGLEGRDAGDAKDAGDVGTGRRDARDAGDAGDGTPGTPAGGVCVADGGIMSARAFSMTLKSVQGRQGPIEFCFFVDPVHAGLFLGFAMYSRLISPHQGSQET